MSATRAEPKALNANCQFTGALARRVWGAAKRRIGLGAAGCLHFDARTIAHEPIEMEGGTTFYFVTDGFEAACAQESETAGEKGVDIAGGASTIRQALAAGVIDELTLDVAAVLLHSGERLFDDVSSFDFEPVEVLYSPLAIHIRYRRVG